MYIQSALPFAFTHIGQRSINQDALYPAVGMATDKTQLFILCDGMGGADKGEIASQLLCTAISDYALAMNDPVFDQVHLNAALDQAYDAYEAYFEQHPFVNRMGSTLALLQIHQNGVTVAHVGDSRVYQIRAGKIVFQTQDHRQVNDMVESGIITATQALSHPWRNRLSRAVVASSTDKKGHTSRSVPDMVTLTDIQAGDYFFMCTDGVLEQMDDYVLETVLASNLPDLTKIQSLQAMCGEQTKDNYSGYLIGISYVKQAESVHLPDSSQKYAD
ncbi:PP2C family protein-serine/threonine phosphatase [Spirosoma radiotolerans]|uniref:Serine/threonine protein phosphatase n=1 Tax=Spirosoma radiotolerans TaxID=1379870 RepID=A0A0E3ZXD5_9BACT|nr:protein phosphatase 2C domain-containing protein [Spirosoma radiotolerans]AKD56149.1 serine/threonine protein phosphatase [Spirosoma radiotolerans]